MSLTAAPRLYILIYTNDHSLGRADGQDIFGTITDDQDTYNSVMLRLLSSASTKIDCYFDHVTKLESSSTKVVMEFLVGPTKRKQLHLRIITNITKDNLPVLNHLMKYSDLYHIDGPQGSFYIVDDTAYLYDVEEIDQNKERSHRLLYSTYPQFIKMQQHLFENLLIRAMPIKEKLKEIEKGSEREFIETIQDPAEALRRAKELVRSASFEILVLFSTVNSFHRAENDGLLDLLGEASSHGVAVRVLIKLTDETMKDVSKQKIKKKHDRIDVNFIMGSVKSKITTIIIDQTFSLVMEVANDSKNSFGSATGLSTYSNSESTVFTYYSMFENVWIQAELERQGKVKDAYFRMFKGQKLKDEIYKRKWNLADR